MISIVKYPSLIKEYYRYGVFGIPYRVFEVVYIKLKFHNFYSNIHKTIIRRNQLRGGNRYD